MPLQDSPVPPTSPADLAENALPLALRSIGSEESQTVSARALHAFLGVGRDFSTWIKERIEQYDFLEGQDYIIFEDLSSPVSGSSKSRPQRTVEYALTLDMAKELCMVERNENGKQARRYFILMERRARVTPLDPRNAKQLRTFLLEYAERVDALETKIAEDAPKVEVYNKFVAAENAIEVEAFAKRMCSIGFHIGRNRCFAWMRDEGIVEKHKALPYQKYVDDGMFIVRETVQTLPDKSTRLRYQMLITPKGQIWLAKRLEETYPVDRVA